MKYFFVLGRNPELSKAEIYFYLFSKNIFFKEIFAEKNLLFLDLNTDFNLKISDLGGTIKLGNFFIFKNEKEFYHYLNNNELILEDKFSYSVLGNISEELFINKFKKDKKKAILRRKGRKIRFQDDSFSFLFNVDFEILALNKREIFFGIVNQIYDSSMDEKIDMLRPVRRQELSISPRLSKIMINLAGLNKGDLMLDPFCGAGSILMQALLKEINCLGVDKDSFAIDSARKNLDWLKRTFGFNANYELIKTNSLKIKKSGFDGIVFEPFLGHLLRKNPTMKEKIFLIKDFEKKIIPFLDKFKKIKKPKARIVMTMPYFSDIQVKLTYLESSSGLKTLSLNGIKFPINEERKENFLNRQIVVLV